MSGIKIEIDLGLRSAEFSNSLISRAPSIDAAERMFSKMTIEVKAWFAAAREAEQIDKSKGRENG